MDNSPARTRGASFEPVRDWCVRHPQGLLVLLTIAALLPFLAKPFNMDDPCYIWAAQQIQAHPADPYGFEVNWSGVAQPMWAVTQNPPLMSYYLAAAAGVFGWSEIGLHFACLWPAVAVVLGTYRLARRFCGWPLFAALATLFAPGFLVSATTVMCDVAMLACWIWTLVFWTEGLRENNLRKLAAAGVLGAAALLTKYNGACLIPLLAAYGWLEKRSVGRWIVFLLIPVAAFFAFEWATGQLYGQGLFSAAAHYAKIAQKSYEVSRLVIGVNALAFTGGCFALALFCAPGMWRKRVLAGLALSAGLIFGVAWSSGMMAKNYDWVTGSAIVTTELQILFWSMGGLCVLALAVAGVWRERDPGAWLVTLWVLGIFAFAAFFNWTVNARAVLPMAPAVGILIARRLGHARSVLPAGIKIALLASAALGLLSAQADFQLASSVRKNAYQVCTRYAARPGKIWFEGHWGFQYYMQSFGARPLDFQQPVVSPGDVLILPSQNANVFPMNPEKVSLLEVFTAPAFSGFATMNPAAGAGFYSSRYGPLPFVFGCATPEKLSVYEFK